MLEVREGIAMRTVEERIAAVQKRSARLRRKRSDRLLGALACLMLLPVAGLVGSLAIGGMPASADSDAGLFGTASLFGSSAGGYVLVAVLTAAIAVATTMLLMIRRQAHEEKRSTPEASTSFSAKADSQHIDDAAKPVIDDNEKGARR